MIIKIIDADIGNINSISNMIAKIGCPISIAKNCNDLDDADIIILPGVGSWDAGMSSLKSKGFDEKIIEIATINRANIVGICLGMQLLCESSDEGILPGLNLIPGKFMHFDRFLKKDHNLKIPHMGWNYINIVDNNISFLSSLNNDVNRFYFVHSYCYTHSNLDFALATTDYQSSFASIIRKNKVTGFQFHPEKSHIHGLNLLKAYIASCTVC